MTFCQNNLHFISPEIEERYNAELSLFYMKLHMTRPCHNSDEKIQRLLNELHTDTSRLFARVVSSMTRKHTPKIFQNGT